MQSVLLAKVPVLRRHVVTESVFVGMHSHLRIARGARGKEHKHRVAAAGCVLGADIAAAEERILVVVVAPALSLTADKHLGERDTERLLGKLYLAGGISVRGAKNSAYARRLEAVAEVMLNELISSGNCYRAYFVKSEDSKPELVMALENEKNPVSALDTERLEVVCALRGGVLYVLEAEAALRHIV